MVLRPFTVDSRQGYESSTVHTSVRIQSKPIAYRLKAYAKKGGNLYGKVSIEPSEKHSMMLESIFLTSTQTVENNYTFLPSKLNPTIDGRK